MWLWLIKIPTQKLLINSWWCRKRRWEKLCCDSRAGRLATTFSQFGDKLILFSSQLRVKMLVVFFCHFFCESTQLFSLLCLSSGPSKSSCPCWRSTSPSSSPPSQSQADTRWRTWTCSSCKGCTVATEPVEAMPSQKAEVDPAVIIVSILFHNCLNNISASQQEGLRGKTVTERALANGLSRHLQGRWRQKKY